MRLWLLFWSVTAAHVTAFVAFRSGAPLSSLPAKTGVHRHGAKSLLDDPLLLAPSSEPGKEHEVVVSDSPAFGLQRTLYTHKRNVRARKPRFQPGESAYMASGPYRSARATVLSTFRRAPGEPYLVNVVLDCRNERGIVRGASAEYHGTRVTVRESQLTARPLFSPYSPPPLSREDMYMASRRRREERARRSRDDGIRYYISRVVNTTSTKELRSIFNIFRRMDITSAFPYLPMVVQLARSLNHNDDFDEVRAFTSELLARLRVSLEEDFSLEQSRASVPWLVWSLHSLHKNHMIQDYDSFGGIYTFMRQLLLSNRLSNLTQGEIALFATGFNSAPFPCKDVYHRLAMLFSYFPPSGVEGKQASTLAGSLIREGICHPGFSRLICEVVRGQHQVLSPMSALFLLEYLSSDPETPKEVTDELFACCSVAEFLKPNASPDGPLFRLAVRLAKLSTSEMEELCMGIRSDDLHLAPSEIMWALSVVPWSPSTSEAIRLLVIRASRYFDELTTSEQQRLLYVSRKLKECPVELIDALEYHLQSMEDDRLLDPHMLKCLARFLPSIPDSRHGCQKLVLDHVERFISFSLNLIRDGAMDAARLRAMMLNVTDCLLAVPILGYELESLARSAAKLLRQCLPYAPDRLRVPLSMLSIQAMCGSYFEEASNAARGLLSDPTRELDADVAPMAELLLIVKGTMEGPEAIGPLVERLGLSPLPETTADSTPDNSTSAATAAPYIDVRDYPVMFSLLARSRLLDESSGVLSRLYVFAEDNLATLSNADLVLMRDGLVSVGAFDEKWVALIDSIPKGIDAVTVD